MPDEGPSLLDYEATLDCVHCGLCLPHCPTYQETGREASSPRGRISLMRGVAEGRLPLDRDVVDEMYFCLACRACESACPSGVRYGHLIEGMRAEIDRRGARSRTSRFLQRFMLRRLVGSPRVLRAAFALLRLYQRTGIQQGVRASGILRPFPGLRDADAMLPAIPEPHRPPLLVPAEGVRRGRVGLLAGCVMPELFGPVNQATAWVLARNGFEVEIPSGQGCCGALHQHAGDPEAAERLCARNLAAIRIDTLDAVVVNSAGCGAFLRDRGDLFASKVRDVSEFLVAAGIEPPERRLELRVAYDDPCHLLHGQRVESAPRELLRAIPGVELVDLPGTRDCCGAAGIYNFLQPEMSRRLMDRKVAAIRETAPDVVATGNPGCMLQLGAGIRAAGLPVKVAHPVELLASAYA